MSKKLRIILGLALFGSCVGGFFSNYQYHNEMGALIGAFFGIGYVMRGI